MKINFYEKFSMPTVKKNITVSEWFELIRYSDKSSLITSARTQPELIQQLKTELPCVTYNFLYDGYKNDMNIIESTGLLFIDIDKEEFQIGMIDKSKVLGFYKSLSGKGYHIVVRIQGVIKDNFKSSYMKACNALGILDYIDTNAIKHSQFSLLSFDEDAYLNDNPFVFDVSNLCVSPSVITSNSFNNDDTCIPFGSNIKKNRTYTYDRDTQIRFDNLNEIEIDYNEKYVTNWDGYEYIRCWLPIKKLKDGRKRFLLSYTTNFVWLNPNLSYEKYLHILTNVNAIAFEIPLPQKNIKSTLNTIMKQLKEKTLAPKLYRYKRKIVFNSSRSFFKGEKQDIVLQEIAINKTNQSLKKIKSIIQNWKTGYGKLTARNIYKLSKSREIPIKVSYKTICKYYKHFAEEIAEVNEGYFGIRARILPKPLFNDYTFGGLFVYNTVKSIGWNYSEIFEAA